MQFAESRTILATVMWPTDKLITNIDRILHYTSLLPTYRLEQQTLQCQDVD